MFSGAVTITKEDSNIVIEVKYLSELAFIITTIIISFKGGWDQNF